MHSPSRHLAFSALGLWGTVLDSSSIRCAVRSAALIFRQHEIPESAASAEYLAISSFQIVQSRKDARTLLEKPSQKELGRFVSLCRDRKDLRKPIQYLVGDWDFHNVNLLVRPPVLIPRPETEELVEHLLNDVKKDNARILDVGCGSGAILLAALRARPGWRAVGVDISEEAVRLTCDNVKIHNLCDRVETYEGSIENVARGALFDAIVSNPPYIPTKDMMSLDPEVKEHEDFNALCGGEDGLDVVRQIFRHAPSLLQRGGSVWLELDTTHPQLLDQMKFDGLELVSSFRDMYGRARFSQLRAI